MTANDHEHAHVCPLCGRDDRCEIARGQTSCWCFTTEVSREALSAIPPEQAGRGCLCPDCARGSPTPCIGVCEMDDLTQTCRGCRRTRREIAEWSGYDVSRRLSVMRALAGRPRR